MGRGAASLSYLSGRGRAKAVILGAAPTLLPLSSRNLRSQSREEARRGRAVVSGNLESRFSRRGVEGGGGGGGQRWAPPRDVVCTCSRSAPFKPKPTVGLPLARSSGECEMWMPRTQESGPQSQEAHPQPLTPYGTRESPPPPTPQLLLLQESRSSPIQAWVSCLSRST